MSARSIARLVAVIAFAVLMLPSAARGHAAYKDSDPPDESTVASAPAEIWAEFTEPPAQGSTLTVFNECGDRVDLGDSRTDTASMRVYVGVDSPHRGEFRVDFRVTSTYDSHVTTGSFTFTATGGEDCSASADVDADGDATAGEGGSDEGSGGGASSDHPGDENGSGPMTEIASISERGEDEGSRPQDRTRGGRGRDRPAGGDDAGGDARSVAAEGPRAVAGIWDGIEIGDLLIGYALAMLIGAAGGKIYAGIVGPRR